MKHGFDACSQAGLFSQLKEKLERFARNTVLRIIEINARSLRSETHPALGIIGE
jgi:hypothetical protein